MIAGAEPHSSAAETIRLRDGRSLAYAAWGSRGGVPIFGFHGGGLCRLQHYGEQAPAAAGVRLLLPDRPGCGRSDADPDGTLLDWANDIRELADRLGVRRFAVFGVSAGGPPALACGFALPDRVAAVGLVSAVGPYIDEPELVPYLSEDRRRLIELARRDPKRAEAVARADCEAEAVAIARDPGALVDSWPPGTPDSDRRLLEDPVIRSRFLAAFSETCSRGPEGLLHDTLLHYVRPWGFRAGDVRVPVEIWHGDRDPFVPVQVARLVARRIPGARLTEYPQEGHSVDYRHIEEILSELAAAVRGSGEREERRGPGTGVPGVPS